MNILTVEGNTVTLVYNPVRERVEVGDNYVILDKRERRGILVQVVEITVPELPGMLLEIIRREVMSERPEVHGVEEAETYMTAVESTKYARSRIMMEVRRSTDGSFVYERWSGYVPSRNSEFIKVSVGEVIDVLRRQRPDL